MPTGRGRVGKESNREKNACQKKGGPSTASPKKKGGRRLRVPRTLMWGGPGEEPDRNGTRRRSQSTFNEGGRSDWCTGEERIPLLL